MKLHLPNNLRSALLFAVLAVSAATPSFAALTLWGIPYDENQQYATVSGGKEVGFTVDQTWNSQWSIVFSVDAASLKNQDGTHKTLNLLELDWGSNSGAIAGATMSGSNVNLTAWTSGDDPSGSITLPSIGEVIFVVSHDRSNNLSLKAYDSANLSSLHIGEDYTLTKAASTGGDLVGVSFGGAGTGFSGTHFETGSNVGSYKLTKVGYSLGSIVTDDDLTAFNNVLSWDGGGGNNWSDASWTKNGQTGQTFTENASVIFAKDDASVMIGTDTTVAAAAIGKDTTFDLNNNRLTANSLTVGSGKTLTVKDGGKLVVTDAITGGTVDALATIDATKSSVEYGGTSLGNTEIKGTLKLTGNSQLALDGTVILGSVVNNLTTTGAYAFLEGDAVTLKFTGTSDLTKNDRGESRTTANKIALKNGKIIVGATGALTTRAIYFSDDTANYNASVTVEKGGKLTLAKVGDTDADASYIHTLTNSGTIASEKDIYVYDKVINNADSTLTASKLKIRNTGGTSSLGGTVNVDTLTLVGGTTNIVGSVTAGSVATDGDTAKTLGGDGGTLTINGATNSTSTANVTLSGSFGIKKTGASTQVLSGSTTDYSGKLAVSGGKLEVTNGMGSAASAELSGNGELKLAGTKVTAGDSSGKIGTVKHVTINGTQVSGADAQTLGELVSLNVEFAAAADVNVSYVTMRDVKLTASGTVTYGDAAKATVATVGEGEAAPAALYAATSPDTPATLTAMAVQKGGTATGTLTIDLTGTLLNEYSGRTLEWKFLDQVTLGDSFTVKLGGILAGMVNDGEPAEGVPQVFLTVGDRESIRLSTDDINNISNATGGLLAGTSGPVDVTLTVKNIPEPTTATLSLLALAALAARRRRK